jgi:N-acetyl sugar amidotransferase
MIKDQGYRMCSRCIMDTTDPDIFFDEEGVCNHCHQHDRTYAELVPKNQEGEKQLSKLINRIKEKGKGKRYDCIIGLSGGVDSTYVALLVKKLGLRPLAVHLDNGWDSELAVKNIENIVTKLNIDLYTIVINWEEFRDLQLSYLKAGVVDLEVTSDHAILASMYKLAREDDINFVISGTNVATESIMPKSWYYRSKDDLANLKDIYKKYGSGKKLKTYPTQGFIKLLYFNLLHKLESVSILNYIPYVKSEVKEIIKKELGWRDYGGKHHESLITKFYQSYILPKRFGIDKRRAHLSNLICSGQITREEALIEIQKPLYSSQFELEKDIEYIIKKFGISGVELDNIMNAPTNSHEDFKTDKWMRHIFYTVIRKNMLKRKP